MPCSLNIVSRTTNDTPEKENHEESHYTLKHQHAFENETEKRKLDTALHSIKRERRERERERDRDRETERAKLSKETFLFNPQTSERERERERDSERERHATQPHPHVFQPFPQTSTRNNYNLHTHISTSPHKHNITPTSTPMAHGPVILKAEPRVKISLYCLSQSYVNEKKDVSQSL